MTLEDPPSEAQPPRWVATVRVLFSVDRVCDEPAVAIRNGETLLGRGIDAKK